jgi:hypothetical protein
MDRLKKARGNVGGPHARRAVKIGVLIALGSALVLCAALFVLRNVILESALDRRIQAYQRRHEGTVVSIGSAKFGGLDRVMFKDVSLWSPSGILTVDLRSCRVKVSIGKMLTGQVRPERVEMNDLTIDLRQDSVPDLESARRDAGTKAIRRRGRPRAYSAQAGYFLDLFFRRVPDSLEINRLTVKSDIDRVRQTFGIARLAVNAPAFETIVEIDDEGNKRACRFAGTIDRRRKLVAFSLSPLRPGERITVPFIDRQWGVRVSFDSLAVRLKSGGIRGRALHLDGRLAIGGLTLNHPRIAAEDVDLRSASVDYAVHIGADYFEVDRLTRVSFNGLSFHPYVKLKIRPEQQLTLEIDRTEFKADDLFSSLPAGLFTGLAGIQTSGELAYRLSFFVDFARPDSLRLESELERRGFKIERFGRVDFRAVNEPFLHTVYAKGRALRSFMVGPENPNFRALDRISPFLRNAVVISEDGAFFAHRGFLLEHFKKSIAVDLKERRFVRGASTISMQLVKNLYLTRQKTVARKLEEMIITWLIEENRLIAKERMYEIYLNIIEWGPGIHGAQEAARFYFDTDAEDLTLAEAIFMASIIPRPNRFMYSFDEVGQLRPWVKAYYGDVSRKMLKREMIGRDDFDTLIPDIRLKGRARFLLEESERAPIGPPEASEEREE